VVIYINGSYSRSVISIIGLIGILTGYFLGAIKYIKEWLANTVVILKAWLSIKGLKVVRNISKVSYS
jgi:hypothetical protein